MNVFLYHHSDKTRVMKATGDTARCFPEEVQPDALIGKTVESFYYDDVGNLILEITTKGN